jgi:thiosulfate/3-mercaptopyruvate sulfurtransferase
MNWDDIFVSVEQLRTTPTENITIFDCRFQLAVGDKPAKGKAFYDESHIPGSHYLDLEHDLSASVEPTTGRHPLPSRAQFLALAERYGLTPNSKIVCYDQGSLAFAARAWFLFHYFGFPCVRLLDGGWDRWQQLQSPSQKNNPSSYQISPTPLTKPSFSAVYIPLQIIDLESALSGHYQLIDAREAHRFRGESEPIDPIAGAIPQAINAVWLDNFDSNKALRPPEWHHARWQKLTTNKPLAHYCGSGVTALVNIISALLANCGTQYFYPGGWSEYIASKYFKP